VEGLTGNLHVLDVTTPNAPVRIANKKLGWNAWRIAVIGTATVHCVLGVRIDPLQSQPGLRLIWASRPGRVYDGYQSKSLLPGAWGAGRHRFAGRAAGEHLDGHHFPDAARGVLLLCRRADTVKPAV
jgi:hypothetical protein